jgi:predicted dehydrogenase
MLRAAVIGLGRMGSTFDDEVKAGGFVFLPYAHAPSYIATPGVRLVAGADPHAEQRAIFGERWGIDSSHLYADYRELLAQEPVDIVSVCTTARLRAKIVIDIARAGVKAIWAEKPLALTLREADEMVAVCQQHGVALAVNCVRRWNPFFVQTRKLIDEGALGEVLQINALGQCGLSHNGSHMIDTMRFLAGSEVDWVFGEMESDEAAAGENDLMGNGYLAFANGARGFLRGMPTGPAYWEFDVLGTEGRVRLVNNLADIEYTVMAMDERSQRKVPMQSAFPWPTVIEGSGVTIVRDLMQAMETGNAPRCSGEDGRAALEVAIALRQSHREGGKKVTLPLANRDLGILSSEIRNDAVPARVRRAGEVR